MLRWMTAGESHGEALTALMDGVPAGVEITGERIARALARRRLGHGRGARQAFEQDRLAVLGGIRHGRTIGSPIALRIGNSEWPKWSTVMSAAASRASRRRSASTCVPSPIGTSVAMTSTTPPSVSPSFRAVSISSTMAADTTGSVQRTGSSVSRCSSSGTGRGASSGSATEPTRTT